MRTDIITAQLMDDVFLVKPSLLNNLASFLNTEAPKMATSEGVANNSVVYERIQHLAIIHVDGAMYKKDMSGMCMSVASYQNILKAKDMAIADYNEGKISKTIFHIDSPGGTVAGIEPVNAAIKSMPMDTITIYENTGASAAIYGFSGSDKLLTLVLP